MKIERLVWSGDTGTSTLVILRATVLCLPMVVVVFLTTIVTWTLPQRPALPSLPEMVLVTTMTFFFTVGATVVAAPATATALPSGTISAAEAAATGAALCIGWTPF